MKYLLVPIHRWVWLLLPDIITSVVAERDVLKINYIFISCVYLILLKQVSHFSCMESSADARQFKIVQTRHKNHEF